MRSRRAARDRVLAHHLARARPHPCAAPWRKSPAGGPPREDPRSTPNLDLSRADSIQVRVTVEGTTLDSEPDDGVQDDDSKTTCDHGSIRRNPGLDRHRNGLRSRRRGPRLRQPRPCVSAGNGIQRNSQPRHAPWELRVGPYPYLLNQPRTGKAASVKGFGDMSHQALGGHRRRGTPRHDRALWPTSPVPAGTFTNYPSTPKAGHPRATSLATRSAWAASSPPERGRHDPTRRRSQTSSSERRHQACRRRPSESRRQRR